MDTTNKINNYNHFFLMSHILLAGWISITILFLILAYNKNVNMHFHIITPICILISFLSILISVQSYQKIKKKEKYLKNLDLALPSYISLMSIIVTVFISLVIINRLIIRTYFHRSLLALK